ncbi:Rho termination factor N-terminal domain-containing protein [Cyanobium sp. NIES-981]|uniref:Rho termination factor N-terminal domain-containing protein n=1 Tax=Cyanobium sp. NIES-981 TaxID=1851505 RepID=UPI0007DE1E67|nr:Rho termination factor N-terminal domain-containing protein [Cyanobium sp. NIES-981]SBO42630.1 conserved protein of unknown function [Cyanobium sp. NIES-981]
MGRIADALRDNLRTIAQSDARSLRALDQELQQASAAAATSALPGTTEVEALLGRGSFTHQTLATLKALCKEHRIKGYSRMKKADLAKLLEHHGIEPPPRPVESLKKSELVALVKQLMAQLG